MRRIVYSLILVTLLAPFAMRAQEPGQPAKMSLQDCLDYAKRNQTKIKNAILDEQSALSRNKEVSGSALPQISASGGISYAPLVAAFELPNFIKTTIAGTGANDGLVNNSALNQQVVDGMPNTLSFAFQPKWSTTASLNGKQLLFDPSVMVALQARKTLEELARKNVNLTVEDVQVGVMKAYYNILIAEKQKGLIEQNIARIGQLQHETEEIYKNGLAEKLDVDRTTVTLNNLETQRIKLNQMTELAYLSLKFQMGMPLTQPIILTDSLSDQNMGADLLAQQLDFASRTEFQLAELQKRLYAYDVKRYRLGWIPTLSVNANYGYTLYNAEKLFNAADKFQKSGLIGVNLSVPIFDGFQRRQKLRQAELTLNKSENDIENLKMSLDLQKENARINLQNSLLSLDNQRKNMELAESVYNTSRIKYKEGVGSSLEVMNAESELKEAQTNYFSSLYDVMTARVDLSKALGAIK